MMLGVRSVGDNENAYLLGTQAVAPYIMLSCESAVFLLNNFPELISKYGILSLIHWLSSN